MNLETFLKQDCQLCGESCGLNLQRRCTIFPLTADPCSFLCISELRLQKNFICSINLAMDSTIVTNLALCRREDNATMPAHPCDPQNARNFYYWELNYNDDTTDMGNNPADSDNGPNNKTATWGGISNAAAPAVTSFVYKPVRPGQ